MIASYIVFNILNVIIQTIKSIVTIKCNKWVAAIVNAVAYGLYTYIVVLTASDLDLWFKIAVTGLANLIGVWVVKYFEEKNREDKLWKIEATFDKEYLSIIHQSAGIPHHYIDIGDRVIFNFYAKNPRQSLLVKDIVQKYHGKYFVSESKTL